MKPYERKKKKGNMPLFIAVFFFAAGYLFFFSSSYWMPANLAASLQTSLGEDVDWGNRTLQIKRWDYCEADGVMEVELDIENSSYDGKNHYIYSAVSRESRDLEVEPVIEDSDWIILRITGVSKGFGEVSLRIDRDEKQTDTLRLYTNVNAVHRVASLGKKDRNGYRRLRLETERKEYEEEIERSAKMIEKLEKKNARMQEEINHLQQKKAFQTEEQNQKTEERIQEIQEEMTENQDSMAKEREKMEENRKRIELIRQQMTL